MRLFKADFQTHFLMSRKPFSQFNVCEKLESGKLLQFIVFQTFDSKLFFWNWITVVEQEKGTKT